MSNLNEFASFNRFSNRSMELIYILSRVYNQMTELASDPSQESINKIASLAEQYEILNQAYRESFIASVKELTGAGDDEIDGIADEDGVRL